MTPLQDSNVAKPLQANGNIRTGILTPHINVELHETIYTSKITISVKEADNGSGQNFVLTEFQAG